MYISVWKFHLWLPIIIMLPDTRLTALCPGLPGWAGTRKVKPIWILLKQETMSGSGIRWAICKSAPRSRQIAMPAPHLSVFYRPDALPAAQPTVSKHWRHNYHITNNTKIVIIIIVNKFSYRALFLSTIADTLYSVMDQWLFVYCLMFML